MKKRIIIAVAVLVIFCIAGTLTVLYNTPDIRIGISHSDDGLVNIPMLSQRCYLGSIGMSQKAFDKWAGVLNEYNNTCGNEYAFLLTNYKSDLQVDTDIYFDHGKTIIRCYGSGTPLEGSEKETFDKSFTLDYKLKLENQ